jgi:hypothetical protein
MILCNVEIHKALDAKQLVVTPEPLPRVALRGERSSIELVAPNGTVWQPLAIRHAMENGNRGNCWKW